MTALWSASNLPVELIDMIVDLLSDDWRALAGCATLHPDWTARAVKHLSSPGGITLNVPDWPVCPDLDDFLRLFYPGSPQADAVGRLTICGPDPSQAYTEDLVPLSDTLALDHLSGLRTLVIRSVLILDIDAFLCFLSGCKSLEDLTLETVGLERPASGFGKTWVERLAEGLATSGEPSCLELPQLQRLRICDGRGFDSAALYNRLGSSARPAPIQALCLHLCTRPTGPHARAGFCAPINAWAATISGVRDTLRDLSVAVLSPLFRIAQDGDEDCVEFWDAFSRCPGIRRLAIHYASPEASYTFPAIASAGVLESFTLVLPYHVRYPAPHQVVEILGTMAAVLSKTEEYPSLVEVRVGVYRRQDFWRQPESPEDGELAVYTDLIRDVLQLLEERGVKVEVAVVGAGEWE
ncbi:hypothetical protein C8Q78DRAFT_268074 [Trametes maxima]|nr:hypothetical protein C8Q78DRAFT_268074 [Trametes maxima]